MSYPTGLIHVNSMMLLINNALYPYYNDKYHYIHEEPCEGEGEETKTQVNAFDFILRAIAEEYIDKYGDIEDINKALDYIKADEISYPKPGICFSASMPRYGGKRKSRGKTRKLRK